MFRLLTLTVCAAALLPFDVDAQDAAPKTAAAAIETASEKAPEALAATIDGTINVTVAEVDALAAAMSRAYGQGMPAEQQAAMASQVRERAIDQVVMQKILLRAADAEKVAVTDAEVDEFFKTRLPPGTTVAEVAEREGMTEAKLRADILTNIRINKLIEGKLAAIPPATDEEVKALFEEMSESKPDYATTPEQVEARHILIKVEKDASEEDRAAARKKLEGIRARIVAGEDFAKLAAESSDCPSGKRGGGSLGTFGRGQMVKPFEDAAFGQEPNVVGEIIATDFGFHVVEVLKKLPAGQRTLESERAQLSEMVTRNKKNDTAKAFIDGLKTAAKVEILEKPAPVPETAPAQRELPVWAQ